jgi:hypothetical protein
MGLVGAEGTLVVEVAVVNTKLIGGIIDGKEKNCNDIR